MKCEAAPNRTPLVSWDWLLNYLAVNMALSVVRDPSGAFAANTATWSPATRVFGESFNSVTGVLGGTITVCEPPAYWTTSVDPLVLLTLPFDMRDCDAVPLVMRDGATLPFVIRLAVALFGGPIM